MLVFFSLPICISSNISLLGPLLHLLFSDLFSLPQDQSIPPAYPPCSLHLGFVINKHPWTDLCLQSLHLGPTKILNPNRNVAFKHYPCFAEMFTANIYSGDLVGCAA